MKLLFLLLAILVPASVLAEWQGGEVVEDGNRVVRSPEEPVETIHITLEEEWRQGGEDDDVLFGVVSQLVQDDEGNIYLLDGQLSEVQVFSSGGEYLRTIGREGEGPGEFRNASDMYLGPGGILGVLQIFPGKIVMLETDDTPAGNFPLPESDDGGFRLIFVARGSSDRVVVAGANQHQEGGKQIQVNYLKAYDPDGNELAHFHDVSNQTRFGGMKFKEKIFSSFARRWTLRPDGRVAAALDFDVPVERTDEELDRFQKLFDGITSFNPGSAGRSGPRTGCLRSTTTTASTSGESIW